MYSSGRVSDGGWDPSPHVKQTTAAGSRKGEKGRSTALTPEMGSSFRPMGTSLTMTRTVGMKIHLKTSQNLRKERLKTSLQMLQFPVLELTDGPSLQSRTSPVPLAFEVLEKRIWLSFGDGIKG